MLEGHITVIVSLAPMSWHFHWGEKQKAKQKEGICSLVVLIHCHITKKTERKYEIKKENSQLL